MFKRLCIYVFLVAAAAAPLAAQVESALPADRLALANQLARRGLHAEALKEYEAVRNEPSVPRDEVLFRLGETYRSVKRPADALKAYDSLLKNHPQSRYIDYARLNRALLLKGAARTKELAALDHDGAPEQIRVTALYWLGETAEREKNAKAAIGWYQKAYSRSPSNDVARLSNLRRASLLAASNDASDRRNAQLIYLDMSESADPSMAKEAMFFVAMLSYRERRHEEAARLFARLVARFPDSDRARECAIYAAWANYLSRRYGEALRLAAPLREAGKDDAYYIVAASLRHLGRRADAIAAYDAAMAAFPSGANYDAEWFERLGTLASDGNHRAVLDTLAKRPHPPKKTAARAWGYGCDAAIALTNYTRAIEFASLAAAHADERTAANSVHRLAWLYERTGDWTRSAQAYRLFSEKWSDAKLAPQALFLAGMAEAKAGRPDQACADWTRLLAQHPASPYAGEALYARASEELRKKSFRQANRSLSELMTRFPAYSRRYDALYWWGIAANGADDEPEAEKHFRAALAAQPTAEFEREIKLELASVLRKRGGDAEAAAMFAALLDTKAADRLPPATLAWISESMASATNFNAALSAAKVLERRGIDADWNQTGAALAGAAYEGLEERDAAAAAYARALATGAHTAHGARAALALGRIESANGLFDAAKTHLADAVERASAQEMLPVRVQAYAALAANEEERGDTKAALGYHMLVGTLFDDPSTAPHALSRAAAILRSQGRGDEAAKLVKELSRRYPKTGKGK